jgi:2,3-bisphosphoglycerate-independent phosphoglycerate mutase
LSCWCPVLQGPSADPKSDQWLDPFVIVDDKGVPVGTVEDGDAVVLFNFRADRMVEISKAFEYPDFDIFDRERYPKVGILEQACG